MKNKDEILLNALKEIAATKSEIANADGHKFCVKIAVNAIKQYERKKNETK